MTTLTPLIEAQMGRQDPTGRYKGNNFDPNYHLKRKAQYQGGRPGQKHPAYTRLREPQDAHQPHRAPLRASVYSGRPDPAGYELRSASARDARDLCGAAYPQGKVGKNQPTKGCEALTISDVHHELPRRPSSSSSNLSKYPQPHSPADETVVSGTPPLASANRAPTIVAPACRPLATVKASASQDPSDVVIRNSASVSAASHESSTTPIPRLSECDALTLVTNRIGATASDTSDPKEMASSASALISPLAGKFHNVNLASLSQLRQFREQVKESRRTSKDDTGAPQPLNNLDSADLAKMAEQFLQKQQRQSPSYPAEEDRVPSVFGTADPFAKVVGRGESSAGELKEPGEISPKSMKEVSREDELKAQLRLRHRSRGSDGSNNADTSKSRSDSESNALRCFDWGQDHRPTKRPKFEQAIQPSGRSSLPTPHMKPGGTMLGSQSQRRVSKGNFVTDRAIKRGEVQLPPHAHGARRDSRHEANPSPSLYSRIPRTASRSASPVKGIKQHPKRHASKIEASSQTVHSSIDQARAATVHESQHIRQKRYSVQQPTLPVVQPRTTTPAIPASTDPSVVETIHALKAQVDRLERVLSAAAIGRAGVMPSSPFLAAPPPSAEYPMSYPGPPGITYIAVATPTAASSESSGNHMQHRISSLGLTLTSGPLLPDHHSIPPLAPQSHFVEQHRSQSQGLPQVRPTSRLGHSEGRRDYLGRSVAYTPSPQGINPSDDPKLEHHDDSRPSFNTSRGRPRSRHGARDCSETSGHKEQYSRYQSDNCSTIVGESSSSLGFDAFRARGGARDVKPEPDDPTWRSQYRSSY